MPLTPDRKKKAPVLSSSKSDYEDGCSSGRRTPLGKANMGAIHLLNALKAQVGELKPKKHVRNMN